MVILDADHPDISEFIACKGKEEAKAKAKALIAASYDGPGPDSEAYSSIFFQNANNSVRVTDEFMEKAVDEPRNEWGHDWDLIARSTKEVVKTVDARELLRQIAEETWACGDPGMQFDTTINNWHTCPDSGRINASNPCSEYMFLDDSACNLASLNLLKFYDSGVFDVPGFMHASRVFLIAQDILVDMAGYPTEKIAINSHDYRPLGLGYANLGALLMDLGLPYDSSTGRNVAAAITALMGGVAYLTSAELAQNMPYLQAASLVFDNDSSSGSFPGYHRNRASFLNGMLQHDRAAAALEDTDLDYLVESAKQVWSQVVDLGTKYGFRNAQVTVLAPAGTIGFMMAATPPASNRCWRCCPTRSWWEAVI